MGYTKKLVDTNPLFIEWSEMRQMTGNAEVLTLAINKACHSALVVRRHTARNGEEAATLIC